MKKGKLIGMAIVAIILVGLIIFASTKKFSDSHLRIEGKRVRMTYDTMVVEDCNEENKTFVYCEKTIKVGEEDAKLVFELYNINENGFPTKMRATVNGNEFYTKEDLDIEQDSMNAYQTFTNFHVIANKYIVFTLSSGLNSKTTTLYAMNTKGELILADSELDDANMKIDDAGEFITYDGNTITVKGTALSNSRTYNGENICKANAKDVVKAEYTYTYANDNFTKKQTKKTTAADYIKEQKIECKD